MELQKEVVIFPQYKWAADLYKTALENIFNVRAEMESFDIVPREFIVPYIVSKLKKEQPRLAVIAVSLTKDGKEGLEVLAQVETPIVIVHCELDYESEARRLGAKDYLVEGNLYIPDIQARLLKVLEIKS